MSYPRIFADFHNADEQSRLRLNCVGTIEDLSRQNIKLQNGQLLTLYSEELEVDGKARWRSLLKSLPYQKKSDRTSPQIPSSEILAWRAIALLTIRIKIV